MDVLTTGYSIRTATLDDLEVVHRNEQAAYSVPWSRANLEASFDGDYSVLVMELQGVIVGHMVLQLVLDELHLHNVCIIPSYQSTGLGSAWLSHLRELADEHNCKVIFLEVRESNLPAIALYTRFGFQKVGERKSYYKTVDGSEMGLVMELKLAEASI